ncbi:MAG: OmpA family protein [Bacteroidales bacterium]|jgi:peptidoglycan-associated lipoprotein|nr:OmpA family protein [Bacteroidales bacterium]
MLTHRPIFLSLFLLFLTISLVAQNRNIKIADQAFADERYTEAVQKYLKGYKKLKDNRHEKERVNIQLAKSYLLMNNLRRAKSYYSRLIRSKAHKNKPELQLEYARILLGLAEYEDAKIQFEEYQLLVPEDIQGIIGLKSIEKIKEWTKNPINYSIENIRKINTRFSEFSPAYFDQNYQSIVYTTTREEALGKAKDGWTGMDFSDLYFSRIDSKGDWTKPETIDDTETVNSLANEGQATLNDRFNSMYFTRCFLSESSASGCAILEVNKSGRQWAEPKIVYLGGDSSSSVGHPTLSNDERTIIFSADFPNGSGGQDLYIAHRKKIGDKFMKARNLGAIINTSGEELFPFLRNDTMLYFASNGHIGMGGLDLYRVTLKNDTAASEIVNMGMPINSSYDDFGIVFHPKLFESGFFSSNRKGGRGKEDIYSFSLPPIEYLIQGIVIDDYSLQPIKDLDVILSDNFKNENRSKTNSKGQFSFPTSLIQKGKDYELIFEKENYFTQKLIESTKGLEHSKTFEELVRLKRIPEKPILLPEILFDLAKWDLKPIYEDSLRGLIRTLDANSSLVIELGAHTDAQGNAELNDILSQKRAESVVDYLILRGIDPGRLVAKGYGERAPRTIEKIIYKNEFVFDEGISLSEEYINQLPENIKVIAQELNRRIEFRVLRRNYQTIDYRLQDTSKSIALVEAGMENAIQVDLIENDIWEMPAIINNFPDKLIYTPLTKLNTFSVEFALKLLQEGIISKDDFEGDAENLIQIGTIAHKTLINVRELSIGNKKIENVQVWVWHDSVYPFIINKETLNRFGNPEFDTKTNKTLIFK